MKQIPCAENQSLWKQRQDSYQIYFIAQQHLKLVKIWGLQMPSFGAREIKEKYTGHVKFVHLSHKVVQFQANGGISDGALRIAHDNRSGNCFLQLHFSHCGPSSLWIASIYRQRVLLNSVSWHGTGGGLLVAEGTICQLYFVQPAGNHSRHYRSCPFLG